MDSIDLRLVLIKGAKKHEWKINTSILHKLFNPLLIKMLKKVVDAPN